MTKRGEQAGALVQHKLNEIINREVEFPAGVLVTITKVEVADNLKYATAWITATPEDKIGLVYGKLRDKIKELQKLVGQEADLQFVPKLRFRVDKSAMAVEEVERLLEEIRKEK